MRALTWNLFHGRDAPPDPSLGTWRSRLAQVTEVNATHAQVNRPLLSEFAAVLERDPWDVALLQEVPPGWLRPLCTKARAHGASALTARNWLPGLRAWAAERNPDLMVSAGGGSNQLLVRPPWRIRAVRRLTLTRRPQRRRMLWARLERGDGATVCVATLHATAGDEPRAARDVMRAADRAVLWARADPLVLGGDLNLRPRTAAPVFERLLRRFGLAPSTAPGSVDHLLVRGIDLTRPPRPLPPGWREVPHDGGLKLRLSDHSPVAAELADPTPRGAAGTRP